ncbi:MAG: hypothetical protein Q8L86_09640 [Vicinamibacterales bacterium]|nr:hypothetical protein [Vicinamibacterales bacterium]
MTARLQAAAASLAVALVAAGCGTSFTEIPIETPIQAKLNTEQFSRVLVAGFISGGSEDVDSNLETVRLLRSQLRTKSRLRVIDADVLPLMEVAGRQPGLAPEPEDASRAGAAGAQPPGELPPGIRDERDFEQFQTLFANVAYWKRIGEEFQQPLIVTGTILFTPHTRSGFVQREQEVYDSFGRRRTVPVRTYMERKGFILRPSFVFIDGRTGETLHTETFREEILYNASQTTPALSSYFELMDRLLPSFLNTLSSQKIRGTRVLLK